MVIIFQELATDFFILDDLELDIIHKIIRRIDLHQSFASWNFLVSHGGRGRIQDVSAVWRSRACSFDVDDVAN